MNKKLKKTLQCTMCAVLSFGMVVCNSSFVEAKKIKKQESVYVNAAADGSVSKITVSDWLKGANETTGTINDISDLKNMISSRMSKEMRHSNRMVRTLTGAAPEKIFTIRVNRMKNFRLI